MRLKIEKKPWGSYFAYTKGHLGKNIIDIYSGNITRRQAGNFAKAELERLKHHPRKMMARGWRI